MSKVFSVRYFQLLRFATSFAFVLAFSTPLSASRPTCSSIFQTNGIRLTEAQAYHKKQFETVFESLYQSRWSREFRNNNEFSDTLFIFADPTEGGEKIGALQKLGFKFSKDVTQAPNFSEFLQNYQVLLDKAQIPKHRRILPALVFGRKVDGVLQFQLVTPAVDPWPTDPGMIILNSAQIFNLPYETILNGLKRGRFPLMDAAHDVFHFVGFVKDPTFMTVIRDAVTQIRDPRPVKFFGMRMNLLIEVLTLAHPGKKTEAKKLLFAPHCGQRI